MSVGYDSDVRVVGDAAVARLTYGGSRSYLHVSGTLAQREGLQLYAPSGDWNALRLGGWRVGSGGVSMGRATLHVDGDAYIAGDLQLGDLPSFDRLSSVSVAVGGSLNVTGALRLDDDWVVSVAAALSAGTVVALADGAVLATGSLAAPRTNVSVGMGARLAVGSMDADFVSIAPGGLLDAAVGRVGAATLQLASAARLSSLLAGVHVGSQLELAPHALTMCDDDVGFVPSGTGVLGAFPTAAQNASATCKWPGRPPPQPWSPTPPGPGPAPWGTHLPATHCRLSRRVCGDDHAADYAAAWLANLTAAHSCLLGPSGYGPIGSKYYNWTQPCAPAGR